MGIADSLPWGKEENSSLCRLVSRVGGLPSAGWVLRDHIRFQVEVFWVMTPCSVVVGATQKTSTWIFTAMET